MGLSLKRLKKGIADFAGDAVDFATSKVAPIQQTGHLVEQVAKKIPEIPAQSPARFLNNAVVRPLKTTDTHVARLAQGQNPYSGSVKQQAGQALQDAVNMASVVPVGRAASIASKGARPLFRAALREGALNAKVGASIGGAQGISTALKDNQSFPQALKTTALNTAVGGAVGGALGSASVAAPGIARASVRGVQAADKAAFTPRIAQNDVRTLVDHSNYLGGAKEASGTKASAISQNMAKAREIASKHGVDISQGTRAEQLERVNSLLDNLSTQNRKVAQGGYAKVPRGKNDPAPDLNPNQKEFINDYSEMLKGVGEGNGVDITADGRRVSNNFRSADDSGKRLTNRDWFDRARQEIESGKGAYGASDEYKQLAASAPKATLKTTAKPSAQLKTRGFSDNIESGNVTVQNPTAQAVVEAIPGYKPITNAKTLSKAASKIRQDASSEYARLITKPQINSAEDVASGQLLLRQAVESGDVESAIQLGTKLGVDGTKLGQAIQQYSAWKRTTPEGIVTYASKQAGKAGRDLDPAATQELIAAAKRIADMPESLEKAKATRDLLGQANKLGRTWKDNVSEILSAPRALMATADFSAPLRQGAILGSRFPKEFAKSVAESAKYMFNPAYYEKEMYALTQRPRYSLMKSSKLSVDAGENLTGTEEQFLSSFLESDTAKKLGVGHIVAASDRAYSGFLSKLRADVFDSVLDDVDQGGVKLGRTELESLSKFINSASGRGTGNITNQVSRLQVLFSARLWKSRLDTLNPAYYARLDPMARKLALQSAASFAAVATTVLGLAKVSGLGDVNADPRSADFGKIKVGNTRYDILGGLQQNIRLAAQLATGQKINSETGELQTLGADRGFGKPSRLDLLYQFVENKENPLLAFGTKALRGTDAAGDPVNLATEAGKLAIPLNAQSVYSTAKDTGNIGKAIGMNLPGTFGIGVQTYGQEKTKDKSKPGEAKTVAQYQTEQKQKQANYNKSFSTDDYKLQGMSKSDKQKLVQQGIVSQQKIDGLDAYAQNKKKEFGLASSKTYASLNKATPQASRKILNEYANMDSATREKKQYGQNDYDYKLLQARYDNDKANGKISKAEDVNRKEALAKAAVGSKYSKDIRELFSLNKTELSDLLSTDANGNKLAQQLFAYDKELTAAGIQKKNKFSSGYLASSSSKSSGGSGSSAGSVNVHKYDIARTTGGNGKKYTVSAASPAKLAVKRKSSVNQAKFKVSVKK